MTLLRGEGISHQQADADSIISMRLIGGYISLKGARTVGGLPGAAEPFRHT